jgi:hypothetical protein
LRLWKREGEEGGEKDDDDDDDDEEEEDTEDVDEVEGEDDGGDSGGGVSHSRKILHSWRNMRLAISRCREGESTICPWLKPPLQISSKVQAAELGLDPPTIPLPPLSVVEAETAGELAAATCSSAAAAAAAAASAADLLPTDGLLNKAAT